MAAVDSKPLRSGEKPGLEPPEDAIQDPGLTHFNLRAEIDTSPPFGSVKEAVTRFGGSGPWVPYYKLGDVSHGFQELDIKKLQDQAAELEKDLIVKELEALDILEELGTTKRIVEELKWKLQNEASKHATNSDLRLEVQMTSPAIKEVNVESHRNFSCGHQQMVGSSSPCALSSPDLILMELKQAKLNLGKTINDLGFVQTSIGPLNEKLKKDKAFLQKTRETLTSKFAGVLSLEEDLKQIGEKPQLAGDGGSSFEKSVSVARGLSPLSSKASHFDASRAVLGNEHKETVMKNAEMRLIAARKMEEAAWAAEAVALAEIKALSNTENSSGFPLPDPECKTTLARKSQFNSRTQEADEFPRKKVVDVMRQFDEANTSRLAILKKLEHATEEMRQSKRALEEALNRVDIASRKQHAAENALRKWIPEHDQKMHPRCRASKLSDSHPCQNFKDSLEYSVDKSELNCMTKPAMRSTISMQDVLCKKQVLPEDYVANREQHAAEAALQERTPQHEKNVHVIYQTSKVKTFCPPQNHENSLPYNVNGSDLNNSPKPVLRPTISMRDVLSRKQVLPADHTGSEHVEGHTRGPRVALSQMLQELRQDLTCPTKTENDESSQKQFFTHRKRLGFIHISLPLTKPSKKKAHAVNRI